MAKSALTMFAYAVAILVIGYATYVVAPPSASAVTALIVPLVMAVLMVACGLGSLLIGTNRRLGMLGLYGGIVLPLVFALVIAGGRLPGSLTSALAFKQAVKESETGVIVSKKHEEGKPHPTGYQAVGMMSLVATSGLAFVVLVLHWPKVPAAEKSRKSAAGEGKA